MHCEVENTTSSEVLLVHGRANTRANVLACLTVDAGARLRVEFKPDDMLADRGKRLLLRADHDGKTVQWPTSFIDPLPSWFVMPKFQL